MGQDPTNDQIEAYLPAGTVVVVYGFPVTLPVLTRINTTQRTLDLIRLYTLNMHRGNN